MRELNEVDVVAASPGPMAIISVLAPEPRMLSSSLLGAPATTASGGTSPRALYADRSHTSTPSVCGPLDHDRARPVEEVVAVSQIAFVCREGRSQVPDQPVGAFVGITRIPAPQTRVTVRDQLPHHPTEPIDPFVVALTPERDLRIPPGRKKSPRSPPGPTHRRQQSGM